MKIKTVISICKKERHIALLDAAGRQWLGTACAFYPLLDAPHFDRESLCATYDIDDAAREKIRFTEGEAPSTLCFETSDQTESEAKCDGMTIGYGGDILRPVHMEQGVMFINEKYLAPFAGDDADIYVRYMEGGTPYFAVKRGFMLYGIIMPTAAGENFADELKQLVREIEVNRENDKD